MHGVQLWWKSKYRCHLRVLFCCAALAQFYFQCRWHGSRTWASHEDQAERVAPEQNQMEWYLIFSYTINLLPTLPFHLQDFAWPADPNVLERQHEKIPGSDLPLKVQKPHLPLQKK